MYQIERSRQLDRKPEEVFGVLQDARRFPQWATFVSEVPEAPPGPLRQDMTFVLTSTIGGSQITTEWRVNEFEPPLRMVCASDAPGGGYIEMRILVDPTGLGCTVRLELAYDLPGSFVGAAGDPELIRRRNERELQESLERLDSLVSQHVA